MSLLLSWPLCKSTFPTLNKLLIRPGTYLSPVGVNVCVFLLTSTIMRTELFFLKAMNVLPDPIFSFSSIVWTSFMSWSLLVKLHDALGRTLVFAPRVDAHFVVSYQHKHPTLFVRFFIFLHNIYFCWCCFIYRHVKIIFRISSPFHSFRSFFLLAFVVKTVLCDVGCLVAMMIGIQLTFFVGVWNVLDTVVIFLVAFSFAAYLAV